MLKISLKSPKDTLQRGVYIPKFRKICSFGAHDPPLHRWGEIWRGEVDLWPTPVYAAFRPIGATRRLCGAKNLKNKIAPE